TLGARADAYHTFRSLNGEGEATLLGIDPRVTGRVRLTDWLAISAGAGLYQQPPSFPVPGPAIDTYALQLGLQRAWQGAASVEVNLHGGYALAGEPVATTLKLTGFYQKLYNTNDILLEGGQFGIQICTAVPPEALSGLPARVTRQIDGQAFGMEL